MLEFNKIMGAAALTTALLLSGTTLAAEKGDWSNRFELKNGHFIEHKPNQVNFDNIFISGKSLNLKDITVNGETLFPNGLKVDTSMSEDEFRAALERAGLL